MVLAGRRRPATRSSRCRRAGEGETPKPRAGHRRAATKPQLRCKALCAVMAEEELAKMREKVKGINRELMSAQEELLQSKVILVW